MNKIKKFLDTPITWGSSLKAFAIMEVLGCIIGYAYCVYEGCAPGPKEVAETVKEKYIELRSK